LQRCPAKLRVAAGARQPRPVQNSLGMSAEAKLSIGANEDLWFLLLNPNCLDRL